VFVILIREKVRELSCYDLHGKFINVFFDVYVV